MSDRLISELDEVFNSIDRFKSMATEAANIILDARTYSERLTGRVAGLARFAQPFDDLDPPAPSVPEHKIETPEFQHLQPPPLDGAAPIDPAYRNQSWSETLENMKNEAERVPMGKVAAR